MKYALKKKSNEIGSSAQDERDLLAFLDLIKEGYSLEEIPTKLDTNIPAKTLRRIAKKRNMWFSNDELEEFRKQKKKKDTVEVQRLKQEELQQKKEEKAQRRVQKEREKQEYLEEVQAKREARQHRMELKASEAKAQEEFREKRNRMMQEAQERKRREKEQKELEITKEKELSKETKKESDFYKSLRKAAKSEDALEYKEDEDIPTKARKKLIDYLSSLSGIHLKINEKDTELILNTLHLYPNMANKGIIKFLILNASKDGGYESAIEMADELLSALNKTKYKDKLDFYKKWAQKQIYIDKIRKMKEHGLNNSQIGEKLRMSSAEIAILSESKEESKFPEFEEK